ncbi:MAG: YhbY family RNA-binding protein [Finegoldia magna]|nr:YhbY family RNA-binding protein [Finegoldia magna]
MITPKQRAKLKKISHGYKPLVNIGKGGISENTLNKREVMKIKILNNNLDDRDMLIDEILAKLDCEFVRYMGNILTIYRESENKVIDLDD